jgi:hypothetical protein
MNKIRRILAPTDLSELSSIGVRYALEFAQSHEAEVIVYYVVGIAEDWLSERDEFDPVGGLIEDQKCLLEKFVQEKLSDLSATVKVRQSVEIGTPYKSVDDPNCLALIERRGLSVCRCRDCRDNKKEKRRQEGRGCSNRGIISHLRLLLTERNNGFRVHGIAPHHERT